MINEEYNERLQDEDNGAVEGDPFSGYPEHDEELVPTPVQGAETPQEEVYKPSQLQTNIKPDNKVEQKSSGYFDTLIASMQEYGVVLSSALNPRVVNHLGIVAGLDAGMDIQPIDIEQDYEDAKQLRQEDIERNKELIEANPKTAFVGGLLSGMLDATFGVALTSALPSASTIASASTSGAMYGALYGANQFVSGYHEEVSDVAFDTVAGAILGGSIQGLWKIGEKPIKALAGRIKNYFSPTSIDLSKSVELVDGKSNAIDPNSWYGQVIFNNPIAQGLKSTSPVLRKFTNYMYRHNYHMDGLEQNIISQEVGTIMSTSRYANYFADTDVVAKQFLKSEFAKTNNYSEKDFYLFVSRSLRGHQEYENTHINQAVALFRQYENEMIDDAVKYKVYTSDPRGTLAPQDGKKVLTKAEVESGIINELDNPVATAPDHFTRQYNTEYIKQHTDEFHRMLTLSIRKNNPSMKDAEVSSIANSIRYNILGEATKSQASPFNPKDTAKIFERVVLISDDALEPFLINNPIEIAGTINYQLSRKTQFNRVSIEAGYQDFQGWKNALQEEFELAVKDKNNKEYDLIKKQYERYEKYLDYGHDILVGSMADYKNSTERTVLKAAQSIKNYNYMCQLGQQVISSFTDLSKIIYSHSLPKIAKNMISGFVKNSASNMNKSDMAKFGAIGEKAMCDLSIKAFNHSEHAWSLLTTQKSISSFHKHTLLPFWNDFWKNISATVYSDELIMRCLANDTKWVTKARAGSIDAILDQFNKYGSTDRFGVRYLNINRWDNHDVASKVKASIVNQTHVDVITPSRGDTPMMFHDNIIGKMFVQYQSFACSFYNQIILPMAHEKKISSLTGFGLLTVTMSTLTEYFRSHANADPEPTLFSERLWKKGLEKSALFGFLNAPAVDLVDMTIAGLGQKQPTRKHARFESLLANSSPVISTLGKAWNIAPKLTHVMFKGEGYELTLSERDLRRIKSLVPYNNLFILNGMLNNFIHNYSRRSLRKTITPKRYL